MGLGDTHEDLPFGHAKTPSAHLRRVFGLVDAPLRRKKVTANGCRGVGGGRGGGGGGVNGPVRSPVAFGECSTS